MTIKHVALYVEDLEAAKAFFIKYFGASSNGLYHNQKTGFKSYFLSFNAGQTAGEGVGLEIMTRPGLTPCDNTQNRMGFFHIAFSTGSKEAVDALSTRLQADGYTVLSGPRTTGDGYYESAVAGIEGNVIEITV